MRKKASCCEFVKCQTLLPSRRLAGGAGFLKAALRSCDWAGRSESRKQKLNELFRRAQCPRVRPADEGE